MCHLMKVCKEKDSSTCCPNFVLEYIQWPCFITVMASALSLLQCHSVVTPLRRTEIGRQLSGSVSSKGPHMRNTQVEGEVSERLRCLGHSEVWDLSVFRTCPGTLDWNSSICQAQKHPVRRGILTHAYCDLNTMPWTTQSSGHMWLTFII